MTNSDKNIFINNHNVDQYLNLDIIAFLDNLTYDVIIMIDAYGQKYIAQHLTGENLTKILPILNTIKSNDQMDEDSLDDIEREAFFNNARNPTEGWYYVDLRYGSMAPVMYFWYTSSLVNWFKRYWNTYYRNNENIPEEIIDFVAYCYERNKKDSVRQKIKQEEEEKNEKILYSRDHRIVVVRKGVNESLISKKFPGCVICDVSSTSTDEDYSKFSPTYPHKEIPVPGGELLMKSVYNIWKKSMLFYISEKGQKILIGHEYAGQTINPTKGREMIFIPSYNWVLENRLKEECEKLKLLSQTNTVVLLDDETNDSIDDHSCQFSHASLIIKYLESLV